MCVPVHRFWRTWRQNAVQYVLWFKKCSNMKFYPDYISGNGKTGTSLRTGQWMRWILSLEYHQVGDNWQVESCIICTVIFFISTLWIYKERFVPPWVNERMISDFSGTWTMQKQFFLTGLNVMPHTWCCVCHSSIRPFDASYNEKQRNILIDLMLRTINQNYFCIDMDFWGIIQTRLEN